MQCRGYYDPHFATKETGSERYRHWPRITQLENYPYFGLSIGTIQLTEFDGGVGEGSVL